jgi:multisubunit Na+/H+ antiporter MnhE subunit
MEHVIQVELRTNTTSTLTWLDASLKPKPGMVLLCKDDQRPWTVVHAYSTDQETEINHKDWRLGDCKW